MTIDDILLKLSKLLEPSDYEVISKEIKDFFQEEKNESLRWAEEGFAQAYEMITDLKERLANQQGVCHKENEKFKELMKEVQLNPLA